jgi:class 3 adenylate cyclase
MARLTAAERAALRDRDFAYVDTQGRRRLPITDAAHVRNALARFEQVEFESPAARERARRRLLTAAKRFRIVPIGFIDRQLQVERSQPDGSEPRLPSGFVTMLMTDIEGSTSLLAEIRDAYGDVLDSARSIQRSAIEARRGIVVEARADDLFAVFVSPVDAVEAGVAIHRGLAAHSWPATRGLVVRVGVHAGYPTVRGGNYIGMPVHATARIMAAAHGGQLLVSGDTKEALTGLAIEGIRFRSRGTHRLRGIPGDVSIHQVVADGLRTSFPAPRT